MKRTTLVFLVIAIGVLFFMFDPFSSAGISMGSADGEFDDRLYAYVMDAPRDPEALVLSLFDEAEIVIIGEQQRIANQVEFVRGLLPVLDKAGIHILGIEFANALDQPAIDELLVAPEYDEQKAHHILFSYMVVWGYREYAELFRAAWELNRQKDPGDTVFRIIGLNVTLDWKVIHDSSDLDDPDKKQALFARGYPEQVMAATLLRETENGKKKAAVLCNYLSSFATYENSGYAERALKDGFPDVRRLGQILHDEPGLKVVNVLLHGPWQNSTVRYGIDYPFGGAIDRLVRRLPEDTRRFGIDLPDSPFADLGVSGPLASGHSGLLLADMARGYIVLGPLSDYRPVEAIPGFIHTENHEQALRDFPGPDPGNAGVDDLNRYIHGLLEQYGMILDKLE